MNAGVRRKRVSPWSVWVTTVLGSFCALEARALVWGDIPTLSECLARWSGVHPRRRHGAVTPLVFLAACGWLALHVATWGTGTPLDKSRWVAPLATRARTERVVHNRERHRVK